MSRRSNMSAYHVVIMGLFSLIPQLGGETLASTVSIDELSSTKKGHM